MLDVKLVFGLAGADDDADREAEEGEIGTDLKDGEEVSRMREEIDVATCGLCDTFGADGLKAEAPKLSSDIADDGECSSMLG